MKSPLLVAVSALLLSACGGKVFVDQPSGSSTGIGGSGGSTSSQPSVGPGPTTASVGVTSSVGTGPQMCGSLHVHPDPVCEACATQSCCAQMAACDQGTLCNQLLGCILDCSDTNPNMNCQNMCAQSFSGGSAALQALTNCLNQSCMIPACQNPSNTFCDSGITGPSQSCSFCMTVECCAEAEKCAAVPDCLLCANGTQGPGCSPLYAAIFKCEQAFCSNVCLPHP